jgi:hypothetical protein
VEEMDCTEDDLDLHLPLPECMAEFCSNLEAIFSDFDGDEQERAVNGQMGSPVLAWDSDDDDAVGLVADDHAPSHSAGIASHPLLHSKRLGQSTLSQSFLPERKNSPSQKKQKLHSGPQLPPAHPPLHLTDITAEAALMSFSNCHSVIHSQFLAHLLLVTARHPVVITALAVAFKRSMRSHQTVLLLDSS